MTKTNVMKILEQKRIEFIALEYDQTIADGEKVAEILNEEYNKVFKTLIVEDNDKKNMFSVALLIKV